MLYDIISIAQHHHTNNIPYIFNLSTPNPKSTVQLINWYRYVSTAVSLASQTVEGLYEYKSRICDNKHKLVGAVKLAEVVEEWAAFLKAV